MTIKQGGGEWERQARSERRYAGDQELIRGVLASEPQAESEFVRRFRPYVVGVLRRRMVPEQEWDDLLQDVFRHLWDQEKRRLRQWECRGECRFSAFLAVVTERLAYDYWRRGADRVGLSAVAASERARRAPDDSDILLVADTPDYVGTCHLRQQQEAVCKALDRLSPRDARLLRHRHLHGASYRQMASAFDMTVNNVGVALARAETRLRKRLIVEYGPLFREEE